MLDPRFHIGRMLVILGVLLVAVGVAVMYIDRIPLFGRLPGDITIRGKNWSFYFPIVTCIVISLILTFILNLFFRR